MTMQSTNSDRDPVISVLLANHRRFLKFLESRVGNREEAEEILQNAFVRSLEKSDQIRDTESAIAWFYRLLRNAVVDHYRQQGTSRLFLETLARQGSDSEEIPDAAMERVICECVTNLVSVLKPEYADLITRVDLERGDVAVIANSLGITSGNARVRLHRARQALRQEVERTCRTCATHGCIDCTCNTKKDVPQ